MTYEFEGKTEKEAIETAAAQLGLMQDQFDVEILESQKNSIFKKGYVRICVHTLEKDSVNQASPTDAQENEQPNYEDYPPEMQNNGRGPYSYRQRRYDNGKQSYRTSDPNMNTQPRQYTRLVDKDEFEKRIVDFVKNVVEKMGYTANVTVTFHEERKLGIRLDSSNSSVLIGKKGAHLDAIQLLTNVVATKLGYGDVCVVVDTENYRVRREESLVHLAYNIADKVHQTKRSVLLEPMNSYERRIIHTTLGDIPDIETLSEGNGAYKRVRIMLKRYR